MVALKPGLLQFDTKIISVGNHIGHARIRAARIRECAI